MNNWLNDITLSYGPVTLTPLRVEHREGLLLAATDGELWNLWYTSVPSEPSIDAYMAYALREKEAGRSLPFVVQLNQHKKIIGSTRFCNATSEHRRVEVGYTWYAASWQRTLVNQACKYLLLRHAFEHLDAIAVEFRTHWHNHASKGAISNLGAKFDGVLRNHMIGPEGILRDTAVYSIIREEWPAVKKGLESRISFPGTDTLT